MGYYATGDAEVVQAVFEAVPMAVVALEGPDHRLAAANASYRAIAGRSDFLGLTAREVFPDIVGQQLFETLDAVYASGQPMTAHEWRVQMDSGGGSGPQDVYMDFTLTPWRAGDGSVRGVLVNQADVTDRVRERQAAETEAAQAQQRYQAASQVVAELQQALLPEGLPVLPGVEVAARYLVAARDQAAGGDWFDAVVRSDGTVALVVGDIVGHGVAASAAMGQLRAVLDELLVETGHPAQDPARNPVRDLAGDQAAVLLEVLARVDRLAARTPSMRASTLCLAILDPGSGAVDYSTCGHPPPLVVGTDGAVRFLPGSGGGPLGTGSSLATATATLGTGEVLLCYSDGLIERPGRSLDAGMAVLGEVAGDAAANRALPAGAPASAAERVCQLSVELLTRTGYDDDVTVLAARRRATPVTPLHASAPAEPGALADVRDRLTAWLEDAGAPSGAVRDLELVVTELLANAVEHAYRGPDPRPRQDGQAEIDAAVPAHPSGRAGAGRAGAGRAGAGRAGAGRAGDSRAGDSRAGDSVGAGGGEMRLAAELGADGMLVVQVSDDGRWQVPIGPAATSGRGLWLVASVVDEVHLDHADGLPTDDGPGTVVTIRSRLQRPAQLGSSPAGRSSAEVERVEFAIEVEPGPPRLLRVFGPVDIATAGLLRERLDVASRGGVFPVVVDLRQVELLASAGVSVLFEWRDQFAVHGHPLTLLTEPGGPATQVLDLVGLDHDPPTA